MKTKLLIIFAIGLMYNTQAQKVDYNTIILPEHLTSVSIEERLVQLAWQNNPDNNTAELLVVKSKYDLKSTNWEWLNLLRVQANLNEYTLNPNKNEIYAQRALYYPRYNFGFAMAFGQLGQNPLATKSSRVASQIAENNVKSQKMKMRAEVLRRYNLYLLAKEKLSIQKNIEQDTYANFTMTEQRFKNGEESVQVYNNILERYTAQRILKSEAQTELMISKINLEELIGLKLDDVLSN